MRRAVLALALGQIAALAAPARVREDELKDAKLDELELGPEGIRRKAPHEAQPKPEVRRGPIPGRQPKFNQALFDRITSRSDEDVAERRAKQAAKLARRAKRAGHL